MTESKALVQETIMSRSCKTPLCLVEFSHANLKKTDTNKIQFELYKGSVVYGKPKRILVASTKHLLYSGSNYEREMFKVTLSVLKLAVLNKRSNRMKLYDVDYFVLKPILKCILPEDDVSQSNIAEQSQALSLEFGTKNRKRAINSRLKFQSAGNVSFDMNILNEMPDTKPPVPESSVKLPSDAIIPPQNANAANVTEIYNISDIISQEEYCSLDSQIHLFKTASFEIVQSWKIDAKYSDIIINYLETNLTFLSDDNAKLLYYLHYMICFLKTNSKDWKKKDPVPEVPSPFKQAMMSRYLLNKSMPQRMKDKLLADTMVLNLFINCFCIDAKILASSAKIAMKRLVNIAYALGCYVHSSKNDDTKKIELRLPLYKHEPFGRKRK